MIEQKVFKALTELKKERRITEFNQSPRFSGKDLLGIDFTIFLNAGGGKVFLQVKSRRLTKGEKEKYRNNRIVCLVISPLDKPDTIRKRLIKTLEWAPKH